MLIVDQLKVAGSHNIHVNYRPAPFLFQNIDEVSRLQQVFNRLPSGAAAPMNISSTEESDDDDDEDLQCMQDIFFWSNPRLDSIPPIR